MTMTIEEKMKAIKVINEEISSIDQIKEGLLSAAYCGLVIQEKEGSPVKIPIYQNMYPIITAAGEARKKELIEQAKTLMK